MAPFRPTNLNKKAYPGNARVIGPTKAVTLGINTTTCYSSTNTCGACVCQPLCLGCRCSFCSCPCCNICCCCQCTVCTRTIPSGMWKVSEQYEAATRCAWGDSNCLNSSSVCVCCANVGCTCIGNVNDTKGFFWCCGGATKYFVAPSCTESSGQWGSANAVNNANSLMGPCGWYTPNAGEFSNAWNCRSYWDSYSGGHYWTSQQCYGRSAVYIRFSDGFIGPPSRHGPENKSQTKSLRAFRNY